MIDVVANSLALRTGKSRSPHYLHNLQQAVPEVPPQEVPAENVPEITPPERGPDITPQEPPEITPEVQPDLPRVIPVTDRINAANDDAANDDAASKDTVVVCTWRRIRHGTSAHY